MLVGFKYKNNQKQLIIMSTKRQELSLPLRVEVAFAVTKFLQLSEVERERILGKLKSQDCTVRTEAAKELGDLLCHADTAELTRFVNDKLAGGEQVFDIYCPFMSPDDYNSKCRMIGLYFHEQLPQAGTTIPLPPLQ